MSFTRIEHAGGAVSTTLSTGIGSGDTSLTLVASTGWPTGSTGPFYFVIDAGLSTEEKILATARSSSTLTGLTRGVDGTSAAAHTAGAVIVHGGTALEDDEANQAVVATLGKVTTKGDALVASGNHALARLAAGADGLPWVANSAATNGVNYAALTATGIGSGAVVLAKFGTGLRPEFIVANASALAALTPTAGDLAYQTDTAALKQYQSATTGWTAPWNLPWGRIIRTASTADQPFANSSENTMTNMNTSFTAVANRLYRVNAQGLLKNLAASVQNITVKLKLDATLVEEAILLDLSASFNVGYNVDWELSPTGGSHALTLTGQSSSASGFTHRGTLGTAKLTVYDAGSSAAPA